MTRFDETWHRLLEWTLEQAPSERLAAQVLAHEGFGDIDPSHPLGGKDGGRDATCTKDGQPWIMAVYFPRGQQTYGTIESKLKADLATASKHNPDGVAFVTNQELRLSERERLRALGGGVQVELFHLERVAHILDEPSMSQVRQQYLQIEPGPMPISIELGILGAARHFIQNAVLEKYLESEAAKVREKNGASGEAGNTNVSASPLEQALAATSISNMIQPWHRVLQPLSAEQLERRIERWEREVREEWPECEHHLAATAWPGLKFRVQNTGEVFLNDVQIIVTISGALGLQWKRPESFKWRKLFPPVIPRQPDYLVGGIDPSDLDSIRPHGYPITWRNLENAVEITIDLKHLRPHPVWESDDHDVVLVLRDPDNSAGVTAEWTVTAQGYGKAYEGDSLTIPVEAVPMRDSIRVVTGR